MSTRETRHKAKGMKDFRAWVIDKAFDPEFWGVPKKFKLKTARGVLAMANNKTVLDLLVKPQIEYTKWEWAVYPSLAKSRKARHWFKQLMEVKS